jgi:hypothetical protein
MQPNILQPQMQPVMQPMQPIVQTILNQVNPLNFVDTETKLANLNGVFIQQKFDLLVNYLLFFGSRHRVRETEQIRDLRG